MPKLNLRVDSVGLEEVDTYIYLGQGVNIQSPASTSKSCPWYHWILKVSGPGGHASLFNTIILKGMT